MDGPAEIRCHQIVEIVTDYFEGALDEADRTRFEMHIVVCRGCENYLQQMRFAAATAEDVPAEEPDPQQMAELVDAFRGWKRRTLEER
jgi:hypothetical protein